MRGVSGVRVPAGAYVSGQATGWPGGEGSGVGEACSGFESLVVLVLHRCLQAHFEGSSPKCHKLPFTERNFSLCGKHTHTKFYQY